MINNFYSTIKVKFLYKDSHFQQNYLNMEMVNNSHNHQIKLYISHNKNKLIYL